MYSIEEICDAMITATSAAVACSNEREFLLSTLHAAVGLLDASCCAFYPAASSFFGHLGIVRVNHRASSDLDLPESLPSSFSDHLHRQPDRTVVSRDWDALATLLPTFDFSCCSSMWICVGHSERLFGTLGFFDHTSRRFDRTQQKIGQLAASLLTMGLDGQAGQRSIHSLESATYHEFSKLVSDVARDLINPLAAIFGYIELLKAESVDPKGMHLVARMEEQIEKARRVIATFSKESQGPRLRAGEIVVSPKQTDIERKAAPIVARKRQELGIGSGWQPASDSTIGARILLVQRSEAVFEFQRSVLNALGAEVIPAFSASDAVELLQARELDAIILDDELEDPLSSKRLVLWVREHRPELADRMLLTVSRKPSPETREILQIAMLPHVTKPLEVLELYSRAQQVLQANRNPHLLQ